MANTKDTTNPRGKFFTLSGTGSEVYVTTPSQSVTSPSLPSSSSQAPQTSYNNKKIPKMVILLTNSLGIKSENNLRLADRFADKLNVLVAVPDLFNGDPISTETAETAAEMAEASSKTSKAPRSQPNTDESIRPKDGNTEELPSSQTTSLLFKIKSFAVSAIKGFFDDMWTARHTFDATMPLVRDIIYELGVAYHPEKIAIVGYSFGGKYVLHLLSPPKEFQSRAWEGGEYTDNITCGAVIHPSMIEIDESLIAGNDSQGSERRDDFANVSKPVFIVYSKNDELLPESSIKHGLRLMQERNVPVEVNVYDNEEERNIAENNDSMENIPIEPLPHGFAVPGDYSPSVVGDRPENVFQLVSTWISEHL